MRWRWWDGHAGAATAALSRVDVLMKIDGAEFKASGSMRDVMRLYREWNQVAGLGFDVPKPAQKPPPPKPSPKPSGFNTPRWKESEAK